MKDGCHVCRWKRTRATLAILPIYNLSERNKWGKRNLTVGWQLTGYRPLYGLIELQVCGFYSFKVSFGARRKSERDRFPSFIIPKGKKKERRGKTTQDILYQIVSSQTIYVSDNNCWPKIENSIKISETRKFEGQSSLPIYEIWSLKRSLKMSLRLRLFLVPRDHQQFGRSAKFPSHSWTMCLHSRNMKYTSS